MLYFFISLFIFYARFAQQNFCFRWANDDKGQMYEYSMYFIFAIILVPNLLARGKKLLLLMLVVALMVFLYYYHIVWGYNQDLPLDPTIRIFMDFFMAITGGYFYYFITNKYKK